MKAKHALILLLSGYCLDLVGAGMKMLQLGNGSTLLFVALILKLTGGLVFLYKLVTYPKWKDFLNR